MITFYEKTEGFAVGWLRVEAPQTGNMGNWKMTHCFGFGAAFKALTRNTQKPQGPTEFQLISVTKELK